MYGAILGDIIGSQFERNPIKSKKFKLFTMKSNITDDTIMSLAIKQAVIKSSGNMNLLSEYAIKYMRKLYNKYPNKDYGLMFEEWLKSENPLPYNGYGNGAAMRISACGLYFNSKEEVIKASYEVTKVTHNHPEGLKAAEATAIAIFMARNNYPKEEIRKEMIKYYNLDFKLAEIRDDYIFDSSASYTMPAALNAFFESNSLIDAIRNAVSLGGDSDTLAAITGSVAGAFYGISDEYKIIVDSFLYDDYLLEIIKK